MSELQTIKPVRVCRETRETRFAVTLGPRQKAGDRIDLPNQLLGHLLDHLLKACSLSIEIVDVSWPGSWQFDHVLCEDIGQLVGHGIGAIHDAQAAAGGVAGRATATAAMDEAHVECLVSFEGRPRCEWTVVGSEGIDGFVDAWYNDSGIMTGWASGTNLRQFFEGFTIGAGATLAIVIRKGGNLHHVYEAAFRALGDAIGTSIGTGASRIPGDTSGLAGTPRYVVDSLEPGAQ